MTTTQRTTPAARRRRLGLRIAMVGTLTGLTVSLAAPAMAASGGPAASAPAAVVTIGSEAWHASTAGAPKSPPKTDPESSDVEQAQLDAFYGAGYGYADAQVLAGCWNLSTPYDAKLTGGAKIKAGSTLPFPPESDPAAVDGDC